MLSSKKWTVLLGLYVAQAVPMSFFTTVVPVIMRQEHYDLETIGMLQLVKLPWILKFLWAPLVDRTGQGWKRITGWIVGSELCYAGMILSLSTLNPGDHLPWIVALMFMSVLASSTQDVATDALAIRMLHSGERCVGNSIQTAGGFLGALLGGGLLLILLPSWGWSGLLYAMALFVLAALLPLWFLPSLPDTSSAPVARASFGDLWRFFGQKGMLRRCLLLALYFTGLTGSMTMLRPMLVDVGYSVNEIGLMTGIVGTSAGALAAFLGGFLIKRLGRASSLRLFALLAVLASLCLLGISALPLTRALLYSGVILLWAAYGMGMVAIYTISMDVVRPGREGTDFTLQIVVTLFSGLVMAVLGGFIAQHFTYRGLFLAETLLAALVFLSIPMLYREQ